MSTSRTFKDKDNAADGKDENACDEVTPSFYRTGRARFTCALVMTRISLARTRRLRLRWRRCRMPQSLTGVIVALRNGRPSFNALQNSSGPIYFYVFDATVVAGRDVMGEALGRRRELLRRQILTKLADPIRESPELVAALPGLHPIREGAGPGRTGSEAERQSIRARPAFWSLAEDAD